MSQIQTKLYSGREIIEEVNRSLYASNVEPFEKATLDNWLRAKHINGVMKSGRWMFDQEEFRKIRRMWELCDLGLTPLNAKKTLEKNMRRVLMAFKLPTRYHQEFVELLGEFDAALTTSRYYGGTDVFLELHCPEPLVFRRMKEAKQLVSDNFEGWAVSKEIDFIVVDDPWEPFEDHPDFVTARILLEIDLVNPEDCKQLLMSLAGKVVGLGRRRIEQVSSSEWHLLMTVEAESIARLSDFISNSLKEQVIVKRTQTFVASQMTMWDRDRGTQYPNQKPSGPPAPGKFINAVVFTRARHGRNVNISGTVGDISASGATAIRVLPCPEADIVVEYRADDRWGLQRFVYDSLGKRNDVDGTETSILIPNSLDDKSPFPAPESPRSAYCRIMAPSKEHNKLSAALEKIEGVVMARGCFGAYDVLAILDVANFTEYEETLDRINKVKGVERVDVLLSRDFLDRQ